MSIIAKGHGMPIRGADESLAVAFSPEGAVPGDRIVGILQPDHRIEIFPINSPALAEFDDEPDRWIDIRWDMEEIGDSRFPAKVIVTAINVPGTLARISAEIARLEANIHTLSMRSTAPDFTEMEIVLQVRDLRQLTTLLSALKTLDCVSDAHRATG